MGQDVKYPEALDLLWGAEEMASVIKRTPRQVHNMLVRGLLPAKKVGSRWCILKQALEVFFLQAA